jgi:hypothetical protein
MRKVNFNRSSLTLASLEAPHLVFPAFKSSKVAFELLGANQSDFALVSGPHLTMKNYVSEFTNFVSGPHLTIKNYVSEFTNLIPMWKEKSQVEYSDSKNQLDSPCARSQS